MSQLDLLCSRTCSALPGQRWSIKIQVDEVEVESYQLLHDDGHTLLEGVEDVLVGVGLAEAHPQVGNGVPGHSQLLSVVHRAEAAPPCLVLSLLSLLLTLLKLSQKLLLFPLQALLGQGGSQQVCLQLRGEEGEIGPFGVKGLVFGAKGKLGGTDEKAVTSRSLWFGLVTERQGDRQAEARGQ